MQARYIKSRCKSCLWDISNYITQLGGGIHNLKELWAIAQPVKDYSSKRVAKASSRVIDEDATK